MTVSLASMSFDGQPILILAAWSFSLGLLLLLPGSAAALAHATLALSRRMRSGLSGEGRPGIGLRANRGPTAMAPAARRHRPAFFLF